MHVASGRSGAQLISKETTIVQRNPTINLDQFLNTADERLLRSDVLQNLENQPGPASDQQRPVPGEELMRQVDERRVTPDDPVESDRHETVEQQFRRGAGGIVDDGPVLRLFRNRTS